MSLGVKSTLKDYLLNSSFHGLRFIADDERHWTERWFWVVCVCLSWYGSGLLIVASWDAFQNNAISFVMDTTYKDWNTSFPAVAVCEMENAQRIYDASDDIWTLDHAADLEEVLKELAFFRGLSYYTLQFCNKPDADPRCPKDNFTFYAGIVRSPCELGISDCKYAGREFDCCKHFLPIDTDIGRCFIINSVQSKKPRGYKPLDMMMNVKTGPGILSMNILMPAMVFTLGEEEVPTLTSLESEYFTLPTGNIRFRRHIAIKNIENDPGAKETTPAQRICRYQNENENIKVYPKYSVTTCTVQCRKDAQGNLCNCSDHFMPNTEEKDKCNMEGLVCLNNNYATLSVLKPAWAHRPGLVCDCPPGCSESELLNIRDEKALNDEPSSFVEILVEYLPSIRYKRDVVRSQLDLVVSTGGTTGLFVGASLLSFVELIYYLVIRYYGTIYMKRKTKREGRHQHPEEDPMPTIHFSQHGNLNKMAFIDIKRTRRDFRK